MVLCSFSAISGRLVHGANRPYVLQNEVLQNENPGAAEAGALDLRFDSLQMTVSHGVSIEHLLNRGRDCSRVVCSLRV